MSSFPPERIYCQDEMRYGTRTQHGRRWMPHGERPRCPVRIGYSFGLLSVALCPYTGDLLAILLPSMDRDCFHIFCQALAEHTQQQNAPLLLLTDRASGHTAAAPTKGIERVLFSAASPELNPVERFFKQLRKELKSRLFDSLQQIEARITALLTHYWQNPAAVVSITCFPYFNTK